MDAKDYTVGAVAGLTGVSVRTLHHYDETGLLRPGGRNAAGYRLYSPQDLQRLQRVLFYRELGFGLDTIAVIVDDPGSTGGDHLRRQRQLPAARIARCQAMAAVIDKELSVRKRGISLTPQERLEVSAASPWKISQTRPSGASAAPRSGRSSSARPAMPCRTGSSYSPSRPASASACWMP
jgi:DNA-binding transcriptional MerR regulator